MLRLLFLSLLLNAVVAGDEIVTPPVAPTPNGYSFTVGKSIFYAYSSKQTVKWTSAGDELHYTTSMTWKFALSPVTVTPERVELAVTILRIQALHVGPGSRRMIDSGLPFESDGHDDPLLGHLLAFAGAELIVTCDPRTGVVSSVTGGDAVVARINKLVPPAFPGDPPPLDAAARSAFSDAALVRIWDQLLRLPTAEPQTMPLAAPLSGNLKRTWTAGNWADELPSDQQELTVTLAQDPTPIQATLVRLMGSGQQSQQAGAPGATKGQLDFELRFTALTQPVQQNHQLVWELTPLQ